MQTKEAIVVVASLVGATIVGTFCYALSMFTRAGPWFPGHITQPAWPAVFIAWFMGLLLMLPLTALVGTLGYIVLQRYHVFTWWSVGLVGAVLGAGAGLAFRVLPVSSTICFGTVTALFAWAVIAGANNSIQRTQTRYAGSRR